MRSLRVIIVLILSALLITACSCSKTKYNVTFDVDGELTVVTVDKGSKVEPISEPKKEGYTFDSWQLNNEKYDFDKEVTSNITLVAKWNKVEDKTTTEEEKEVKTSTYTVKFTDDDSLINSVTVKKNSKVVKPTDPVKEGYKFLGWYLDGKLYSFTSKVKKDITLTAMWEKVPVINYSIEKVSSSSLGQVKIYVTIDDVKTEGYIDLTEVDGTVHKNILVKSTGLDFNEKLIKEIKNVKIK